MKRWIVLTNVLFWLLLGPLAHAQAPNFAIQNSLSGLMGSTFVDFVSLVNNGTSAADNVMVTSVTLDIAALTSPVLPVSVGRLSVGDHNVLDLRFDGTNLMVGNTYLLTVQGSYQAGTQTSSFTATQPLTITIASGFELQRWVALDDVKVQFASLPGLDPVADAQAVLTFLRSRTEFADSGIADDSSSIWARFSDGQAVIISQDRDIPLPSSSALLQTVASQPPVSPRPQSKTTSAEPASLASAPAAAGGFDELPVSPSVRVLNTLGPGYGGADLVSDITAWLSSASYNPVAADASVDSLKTVGGDGVFYISSHGGFEGHGTAGDPFIYAVWTSTVADPLNDVLYRDDLSVSPPLAPQPRLVREIAKKKSDSTGGVVEEDHYAFTAQFVRTYWKPFSANSFIYIDICNSGTGGAGDFQNALFGKGADVFAGWTFKVLNNFAGDTARLVFDRLLGSNTFVGPAVSVGTQVLEFNITGFNQRPFDYQDVSNTDMGKHKLGVVDITKFLNFIGNPSGSAFGLLAPSLTWAVPIDVDGSPPFIAPSLEIVGTFGVDPASNSKVTVGGQECPITLGNAAFIVCALPSGAAGNVVITSRNHQSNTGTLTHWNGTFNSVVTADDSLTQTVTYNAAFRADVREFRFAIHDAPKQPSALPAALIIAESSASYSCSGSASKTDGDTTTTITWTGGGNIPVARMTTPPPNTFQMTLNLLSGAVDTVHGTGPGCDFTVVTSGPGGTITFKGHNDLPGSTFNIGALPAEPKDPSFPAGSQTPGNCSSPPTFTTPQCRIQWGTIGATFPPDPQSAR